MNITFDSTVLFVKDIKSSKIFYNKLLNLEVKHDFGNNISFKCGLSLWQIPDDHKLHESFYKKSDSNKALELYFETENINEVKEFIDNELITKFHDEIEESWGQRTIRIYDPDNNLIEIGESVKTFIKRMSKNGLSITQIATKTGIPEDMVEDYMK